MKVIHKYSSLIFALLLSSTVLGADREPKANENVITKGSFTKVGTVQWTDNQMRHSRKGGAIEGLT